MESSTDNRIIRVGDRVRSLDPEDGGAQGVCVERTFPSHILTIRWDGGGETTIAEPAGRIELVSDVPDHIDNALEALGGIVNDFAAAVSALTPASAAELLPAALDAGAEILRVFDQLRAAIEQPPQPGDDEEKGAAL